MGNQPGPSVPREAARHAIGLAAGTIAAAVAANAISALPASDRAWPEHADIAIMAPRAWDAPEARDLLAGIRAMAAEETSARQTRLLRTPGPVGQVAAAIRERWIATPSGPGAERFDRVYTPRTLREATRLIVAPAAGATLPMSSPVAIAAAFAHPRQRMAVRAEGAAGALAELAAPLAPLLTIAVARVGDRWLAAAAADPVAAELAWLGLAELASGRADVVPWQNPAVQRLCLLGPFAKGPDEIAIVATASVDAATLQAFAEALGVTGEDAARGGQ
ncbi:MAG TPA: hypothetical protein VFI22_10500 [Thermomicrobiales bacterium]|nr:hypothetical protein [Thermomicrobiales bacterium]